MNAVLPGLMKTPIVEKTAGLSAEYGKGDIDEMWKVRDAQCPMGHMGDAWDVAYACLYLRRANRTPRGRMPAQAAGRAVGRTASPPGSSAIAETSPFGSLRKMAGPAPVRAEERAFNRVNISFNLNGET